MKLVSENLLQHQAVDDWVVLGKQRLKGESRKINTKKPYVTTKSLVL